MHECCWCGKEVVPAFTVSEVFSFSSLSPDPRCEACAERLVPIVAQKACPGCSRNQGTKNLCPDCLKWQQVYPELIFSHTALYEYDGLIREWLEAYKFKGDYRLASFFAKDLKRALRPVSRRSVVLPVPVHPRSLLLRGFNQVEGLLQAARIPYLAALEHTGSGKKQSEKNRAERMTSPQPFKIKESCKERIRGKKVWIVDDVYTTGRTLFHARDVVKEAGAKHIETFTLAR